MSQGSPENWRTPVEETGTPIDGKLKFCAANSSPIEGARTAR
jgi:hypothetical protein